MAETIRYPWLFRVFSWGLLITGLVALILFTPPIPSQNWIPLAGFALLSLLVDRYAILMPGGVYLSLETTFHLACALLFGPPAAAWMAGTATFISEQAVFRRSLDFSARTAGMYIWMWLAGGWVYRAVGGEIPLGNLDGPALLRAFLLFLTATAVNFLVMSIDNVLRGQPRSALIHTFPNIMVIKTAFAPFGIVGALVAYRLGVPAALFLALGFLLAIYIFYTLQKTSETLRHQVVTRRLLNDIGQILTSSLEMQPLLERIYEGIRQLMEVAGFWIALYDEKRQEICYELLYDEGVRYPPDRVPYDPSRFLAAYTIQQGMPLFLSTLEEVKQIPIYLETVGSGRLPESLIAVPIFSKGKVLGAISVQSYEPHAYKQEDLETLMVIARQAGIALENARLFREVEQGREYLQTILDSVDYAILMVDPTGRIQSVNRAVREIFGVRAQETMAGLPMEEAIRHQAIREIAERIRRGEIASRQALQVALSDDRMMVAHICPVLDALERQTGYVIAMADVTPLHRLNQLKSQVIRMASHDLRNPLQLASGFFQILLEDLGPLKEEQADLARRVLHHLKAMEQLIDDLLELERVETVEYRMEPVDLGHIALQAVGEHRWRAESKGLRLWCEIAPKLPPVLGDRRLLVQAISNLLDNAVKYTPQGGEIFLRVWAQGNEVLLTVKDTGIGIPPEAIPHVFKQFYRARQPGTEEIAGTGLGLSLVQSVIQEHRGRVWVESEGVPGKGSLFGISLPALHSPVEESRDNHRERETAALSC
ncbi:MAG: GAF domain-containing sensor histidine kinase [Anaerolineae bacterium]|nr:GAF domain-containing sensor histidine kinase [Anaerolineae bacterium]MDW7992205.1 GAF domain-containing sensor histidine kinase [Anaerolineae bacterium]